MFRDPFLFWVIFLAIFMNVGGHILQYINATLVDGKLNVFECCKKNPRAYHLFLSLNYTIIILDIIFHFPFEIIFIVVANKKYTITLH